MNDWRHMARESGKAAKELLRGQRYRSSISRSYYASYSLVTHRLVSQGMKSFGRFNNPPHADVAAFALTNLAGLSDTDRRVVSRAVRVLRMHREDADYRPHATVDAKSCRDCAHFMSKIFKALGEPEPAGGVA